jgi:transposase
VIDRFVASTTGRVEGELVSIHCHTASSFYTRLRRVISEEMEKVSPVTGEIEVDESDFGGFPFTSALLGLRRVWVLRPAVL